MIIDFHTHVFPDKIAAKTIEYLSERGSIPAFSDGLTSGLLARMEEAGVDVAVNLPVVTAPRQFESVNRFAKELNERFSATDTHHIISFAGIHPLCEDIDGKMQWIKENGFVGVKLHPDYQETYINDPAYVRILECARDLDLVVLTHAGLDVAYTDVPMRCPAELVLDLCRRVPYEKLVIAHLGGYEENSDALDRLCGENIYLDTAYILRYTSREKLCDVLSRHGAERVLFASDSPWSSMKDDVEKIKSFSLDPVDERRLMCDNARTLLGI